MSDAVRVLVVEDDLAYQRVLEKRLTSEGFDVRVAADGREGMKLIVTFEPDIVISDWMMPHVDGLELCQSIKTGLMEAAPFFILLTARGEISDQVLGLETGADEFLVKPCDQGELMARVRSALRNVHLTRELRRVMGELGAVRSDLEAARAEIRRLSGEHEGKVGNGDDAGNGGGDGNGGNGDAGDAGGTVGARAGKGRNGA